MRYFQSPRLFRSEINDRLSGDCPSTGGIACQERKLDTQIAYTQKNQHCAIVGKIAHKTTRSSCMQWTLQVCLPFWRHATQQPRLNPNLSARRSTCNRLL